MGQADVKRQSRVYALDRLLAIQVLERRDDPPAPLARMGVPNVVLLSEDELSRELLRVLDYASATQLRLQVSLDSASFIVRSVHRPSLPAE